MIEFKAKHLHDQGFGMILPGNGGEEQLAIFSAFGQDGTTHLLIVASACDGAPHKIMYNTGSVQVRKGRKAPQPKTLTPEQALEAIHDTVIDWANKGTDVSIDQHEVHERQIGKLVQAIGKKFGLTKTELAGFSDFFTEKQARKLAKHAARQKA